MDKKIALLKARTKLTVVCKGHTCDLVTNQVNLRVCLRRAEVVRKYLIKHGIVENRLAIVNKTVSPGKFFLQERSRMSVRISAIVSGSPPQPSWPPSGPMSMM